MSRNFYIQLYWDTRPGSSSSEIKINYMKNKSQHGASMKAIELVNKYKKKTQIEIQFINKNKF